MIEPYFRYCGADRLKRHHKLIFKMWQNYKNNSEIAEALCKQGCLVERKTVSKYINRCLEDDGLEHIYIVPRKKTLKNLTAYRYHEEIFYARNFLGHTINEIAVKLKISKSAVSDYIRKTMV